MTEKGFCVIKSNEARTYVSAKVLWRKHKFLAEFDPTPSMYYVYVLRDIKTNELYYGYTNDVQRRIIEHNRNKEQELIYYEAYRSEIDARNRERRLKNYAQALTALKSRLIGSLK